MGVNMNEGDCQRLEDMLENRRTAIDGLESINSVPPRDLILISKTLGHRKLRQHCWSVAA